MSSSNTHWLLVLFAGIVAVSALIQYVTRTWGRSTQLKCVISTVDGNRYCVRKTRDHNKTTQAAADRIAAVTQKCVELVDKLYDKHPDDIRAQRLKQRFDPTAMSETLPTDTHTAVTNNKGESMQFCLNHREGGAETSDEMIDEPTLYFVALHELSHIAYVGQDHDSDYWVTFKWLLHEAESLGMYTPTDYKQQPRNYCGVKIEDNPYY